MDRPENHDNGRTMMRMEVCLVHGQNSARNLQSGIIGDTLAGPKPMASDTQQAVIADALSKLSQMFFLSLHGVTAGSGHGSPLSDQSNAVHRILGNNKQPYSQAACVPQTIRDRSDFRPIEFPIYPARALLYASEGHTSATVRQEKYDTTEHHEKVYAQLIEAPSDNSTYRVQWVNLPQDIANESSIGAAILLPTSQASLGQRVLICNLRAGWGPSPLEVEVSNTGVGVTRSVLSRKDYPDVSPRPISVSHIPTAQSGVVHYPDESILISHDWAQYLNPFVPSLNTSLFDILMRQTYSPERESWLGPALLSMLASNGLSRTSWESELQGKLRTIGQGKERSLDINYWIAGKGDIFHVDPLESKDWVSFQVESSVEGYAYNTLTSPPKIAIAIMMIYCILVLGHTLYSGITGISSNCWDTIAEVTALAINSTPTAALRNTCAGISELHIFKLPVRILVSRDEEGEGEHLELVFGKGGEECGEERTIKTNTTYGTLPSGCGGEGKKDV
ncbi:MAG: hypothetical protein Q9169_006068 [Polycauliona sp. 2 TL-2023]